jgi:hypothetical protein
MSNEGKRDFVLLFYHICDQRGCVRVNLWSFRHLHTCGGHPSYLLVYPFNYVIFASPKKVIYTVPKTVPVMVETKGIFAVLVPEM